MAARIGKAVTDLLSGERPFSPEEVRAIPAVLRKQQTPEFVAKMIATPELIVKHIHNVRGGCSAAAADPLVDEIRAQQAASAERMAKRMAGPSTAEEIAKRDAALEKLRATRKGGGDVPT